MASDTGRPTDERLMIFFDAHECKPSQADLDKMTDGLETVARQVENFPLHDVRVVIEWKTRTNEYVVKVTLLLPGRTIVGSDHDSVLHAAFERVLVSLEANVRGYKDQLGQIPERQKLEKHTHQDLVPSVAVDAAAVERAVRDGDYAAFRVALLPYEDGLRVRVGRWIERYPELQARMGKGMEAIDVMEGVFLAAFEAYDSRPIDERFGEWLVTLIDPTIRDIAHDPDGELENINMARTASDAGALGELGGSAPSEAQGPPGNPRPFSS